VSYGSLPLGNLDSWCSIFFLCYTRSFACQRIHRIPGTKLAFLDLSNLSPRLPARGPGCVPGALAQDRIRLFESDAERVLDTSHEPTWPLETLLYIPVAPANHDMKMSETLLMCSTMITLTTRRTTFTESAGLPAEAKRVPLLPCSPLIVRHLLLCLLNTTNSSIDQKQARDLVNVLREAKQQIDPRLEEMTRYGGGGGGGRYGGYRGGRGGGRGKSISVAPTRSIS
jgi:hypothetical protein